MIKHAFRNYNTCPGFREKQNGIHRARSHVPTGVPMKVTNTETITPIEVTLRAKEIAASAVSKMGSTT